MNTTKRELMELYVEVWDEQVDIISYFVMDMRYYVDLVGFRSIFINEYQWLFGTDHDFIQVL